MQLTEHVKLIWTEWFWCDWYSVPQWSRNADPYRPDPLAQIIFQTTMKSFHTLCTHSGDAIAVVKRGLGLKMRGFDEESGWQIDKELTQAAGEADEQLRGNDLRLLAEGVVHAGVDLEYGVRAWCALERCYLPSACMCTESSRLCHRMRCESVAHIVVAC